MGFSSSEFKPFKLEKIERVNHNVKLFRFSLPTAENRIAGLPVASCVIFRHVVHDKQIIRPYTPTALEKDYIDFVVKDYPKGNMSRHLFNLQIGDEVEMKGPVMKYDWEKNPVNHVGMIAAGTGITPMLQFLRKVFSKDSTDKESKFTLIYANQEEQDILFREELDQLSKEQKDRFKLIYVLEHAGQHWKGPMGYVTKELLEEQLPSGQSMMLFVCGPPAFMDIVSGDKNKDKSQGPLKGFLKGLGYKQERVHKL